MCHLVNKLNSWGKNSEQLSRLCFRGSKRHYWIWKKDKPRFYEKVESSALIHVRRFTQISSESQLQSGLQVLYIVHFFCCIYAVCVFCTVLHSSSPAGYLADSFAGSAGWQTANSRWCLTIRSQYQLTFPAVWMVPAYHVECKCLAF